MSDKKNIADESARTRKILEKRKPWTFNPLSVREMNIQPGHSRIGEYAVMCLVGPYGPNQYTICRPIGITDLAVDDWVMIPTGQIPATLARSEDPNKQVVDKQRSKARNEILVSTKLLKKIEKDGRTFLFYPHDEVKTRADHLTLARSEQKAYLGPLRSELKALPKKGAGQKRQELNVLIQQARDLLQFLQEDARTAEIAIRKKLSNPATEDTVCKKHPYTHRTLVGPFGDQPQVAIIGAKGFPLVDVVASINKLFTAGLDLTQAMADEPSSKSAPRGRQKTFRQRAADALRSKSTGPPSSK